MAYQKLEDYYTAVAVQYEQEARQKAVVVGIMLAILITIGIYLAFGDSSRSEKYFFFGGAGVAIAFAAIRRLARRKT